MLLCHVRTLQSSPTGDRRQLLDTQIKLIDFGSAVIGNHTRRSVVSTRHYRGPEIVFNIGWNSQCDMWSAGCVLAELYAGEPLFQTHDNREHTAMMERVLGPVPSPMANAYVRWTRR